MKMKTTIKAWLLISSAVVAILATAQTPRQTEGDKGLSALQDAVVLEMAAAFKKNDSKALTRLLPRAKGSTLEPWAAYWETKARLADIDQPSIDRFAQRYPNTYVADRLRADWLLLLGQRRDWAGFAANYPAYRMRDDKDIRCYAARDDAVLAEQLWMSQKEVNTGCGYVATALIEAGKMDAIVQWRKTYKGQTPPQAAWDKLSAAQKNWAWGFAGRSAAQKLDLDALSAFANVTQPQDLAADMQDWWARAALRRKDWSLVIKVIDGMASEGQKEWAPWREIALAPTPSSSPIAKSAVHFGVTGADINAPAPARQIGASNLTPALAGLQRAIYAIQSGLRPEGVREWNYEVNLARGSMSDHDRLAAADLACKAEVWDRCINTSERTVGVIDWQQRYPMPYKSAILAASKVHGLDPAFVYGLIRQESRFVADIQSHVGAAGLMQLMPATARWTAKRVGLNDFTNDQVQAIEINTHLGSAYLKYVLDEFGGNTALAAAAYNAGPQRVRQWRAAMAADTGTTTPLDIAIWSENIPFLETRGYVKNVISNQKIYVLIKK
jgi:soluble lytic murein transglycosylase